MRDHVELAEICDLIDFSGRYKVAGHGLYFLKNEAVLLELATCAVRHAEAGGQRFYTLRHPRSGTPRVLEGTGYNPRGNETQIYLDQWNRFESRRHSRDPAGWFLEG